MAVVIVAIIFFMRYRKYIIIEICIHTKINVYWLTYSRRGLLEIHTAGTASQGLSLQDTSVSKRAEAAQPVSFSNIIENPFTAQQHSKLLLLMLITLNVSQSLRVLFRWTWSWWFAPTTAGTHDPIKVANFPNHVRNLHANDDYLFTEEYSVRWLSLNHSHMDQLTFLQNVEPDHSPTTEATRRPVNISKNRYANITACT